MNKERLYRNIQLVGNDKERRMLLEAELVKQLLDHCSHDPGASIEIIVQHDNGHKAVARLYDHAALVNELYKAIDYFQDELMS